MIIKPKVSVLIPTYNSEKYIVDTIKSVLNQSYKNLEIIITDDCSTDKTVELISKFRNPRILLFQFTKNKGISSALNNCIEKSKGEYLAVLGSDDIYKASKLTKQIDFLEKNLSVGAIFTLPELIDDEGAKYRDSNHFYDAFIKQENRTRHEWLHFFFFNNNVLCASSAVIRRECQVDIGLYDERFLQLQDMDMWIRICMKYEMHILQEHLTKYRIRHNHGNISGHSLENQIRLKFEQKEILKNYLSIKSAREFKSIFPSAPTSSDNNPTTYAYKVAQLALAVDNNIHQMFGVELLYDLMGNDRSKKILAGEFGFSNSKLYKTAGKTDVFDFNSFHTITSSKFFKIWQLFKQFEKTKDISILGIFKKIKFIAFTILTILFDTLIHTSVRINLYKFAPSLYSLKRRFQLFFYEDSIDSDIHYIQSPRLMSIKKYATEHNLDLDVIYTSTPIASYPPHYYKDPKRNPIPVSQPEIFVMKIKNVHIIGSTSVILTDRYALLEENSHFPFNRLDLRSDVIREHFRNQILVDSIKSDIVIEKGIMMCGTASNNYYHWLIEFLPKYHLIEKLKITQYPLLIDEAILNTPQLYQSLKMINTLKLQIIPIKKNHHYSIQELVYPSLMSWTAINIRPNLTIKTTDSITSPHVVEYLQHKFIKKTKQTALKKIYISRGGTLNRKFNEADVLNVCKKFNYEIVNPQLLSFTDQIRLFSQARIIVGASGAAMTNIVFAPKGTKILCLKNARIDLSVFSNLAALAHQDITYLDGIIDESDPIPYYYQKAFKVDLQKLEDALKRIELVD